MKKYDILNVLSENTLFSGICDSRIEELLGLCHYSILELDSDTILSSESEPCKSIGFVLSGKVNVYKSTPSGNRVVVKSVNISDYYGEALVFSSSQECPSTIITAQRSSILTISSKDILKICENEPIFLKNMLVGLSDKVFLLNRKIKLLSYPSVRQRLSSFLLDEVNKKHSSSFLIDKTREELGDLLGVARPSVSRELSRMASDGLIALNGRSVEILDIEKISSLL